MLVFVGSAFHPLSAEAEERYRKHENSKHDDGYVSFLMQAITPALPFLDTQMVGLDYGCGPTPTLSHLMDDRGFNCENYDPIFFPILSDRLYDFIFSTECFEHFISPKSDITKVLSLLKPGGLLVVMTDTWTALEGFNQWYYTRDFTHVSFYHKNTFDYICLTFNLTLLSTMGTRVFVMRKNVK